VLDATLPSSVAEGRQWFQKYTASSRIFLPNGRVPRAGERFFNRDYAATLKTIASEGAQAFYRGSIGKRIAADMLVNGGLITEADLGQYRAIERKPVSGRYRGHVLYTGGPPVSAGVSLIEALQILGNYGPRPRATVARDADYLHYLIESWKARDRIARIADPAQWAVDYDEHLQTSHAAELFARIQRDSAARFSEDSEEVAGGPERIGSGTSGVRHRRCGRQHDCRDADAEHVGRLVLRDARTRVPLQQPPAIESHDARRVRAADAVDAIEYGEPAGAGLPQPGRPGGAGLCCRVCRQRVDPGVHVFDRRPRSLTADSRCSRRSKRRGSWSRAIRGSDRHRRARRDRRSLPARVLQDLMARGHRFQKIGRKGELRYGYASGVLVDTLRGRVEGGADPRRSHAAVAVEGGATLSQ
jgi:hypothetical protein